MKLDRKKLGFRGEQIAAEYLKKKGYTILEYSYRSKLGEIDLVVCKDQYICFVEVKTRKGNTFGPPQAAVDQVKQQRIAKAALCYLKAYRLWEYNYRFDVISILIDEDNNPRHIDFIENAFNPAGCWRF